MKTKTLFVLALLCTMVQGIWATDYNVKNDSELRAAIANDGANISVTSDLHSITAVSLDGNEAKLGSSLPEGTVYITDVMLVGDYWKSDATAAYNSYVQQGWTGINVDLNEGAGTLSHYIYLLYKTNNSSGSSGVPITDFYLRVSTSGDAPNSFVNNGRTYQLTSYTNGSDDDFRNSKGDLNTNAGGDYKIHLYYTKGEYAPGRAVTSINIVQPSTDVLGNIASDVDVTRFLCENGFTTPCNLNKDAGGAFLCMSVTKALTEPVTVPDGGVYYIEHGWDNVNQKLTGTVQTLASGEFTKLSNKTGDLTLNGGNYVVQGNVHVEDIINVTGNTNLILCDGAKLTVAKGILVSQDCTLSIFGQAENSGRLENEQEQDSSSDKNACPGIGTFSGGTTINIHGCTIDVKAKNAYAAAIGNGNGNNKNHEMGTINIYEANITATGGYTGYVGSAAIGSWDYRANGAVNIYGGNITVSSVFYGPGIGTGNCSDEANETVFTITINGGNVVATGGLQAAGIGGGYEVQGATVTINGGRVEAHGGDGGAGIGSGQNVEPLSGGTLVVNGGEVYADGGEIPVGGAAGIGGGEGCHGADVTVNGGKVYAYGVDNAAGIGSGDKHNMDSAPNGGKLTVNGGEVYAYGEGKGAGIGGGQDGAGADVTITGGIVVAQSGGDQRAIGAGYGSDSHGSLTFADDLGVFVTTQLNRSVKANRVIDCRNFAYVRVDKCAHGGHAVNSCKYCFVTDEELHTFGDYGECPVCGLIGLADNADNSSIIAYWDDQTKSVALSGRTLYKDGDWNTLCLPFNFDNFDDTIFEEATVKELDTEGWYDSEGTRYDEEADGRHRTGFENDGTLYLYFKDADEIEAGKPYLVKWDESDDITYPMFSDVEIDDDLEFVESEDDKVQFIGIYNPVTLTGGDASNLYLGDDNNLYWPSANRTLNAFRAYFHVDLTDDSGEPMEVHSIRLNLDSTTGVESVQGSGFKVQDALPAKRIVNGKLIIEKSGRKFNAAGARMK